MSLRILTGERAMELYLIQHGLAKPSDEDPDRPLTDEGIRQTESMVRVAGKIRGVDQIWHSGKKRAEQTTKILSAFLKPAPEILVMDGLEPNEDPRLIKNQIESLESGVLIVGHLPHLEKLVGLLLCGNEARRPIEVKNSALLCLTDQSAAWAVRWYVVPEMEAD